MSDTDTLDLAKQVLEAAGKATANPGPSPLRPSPDVLCSERLNQEHAPALAQAVLDASAEIERLRGVVRRGLRGLMLAHTAFRKKDGPTLGDMDEIEKGIAFARTGLKDK
mgnify:CR=1 FL=1